MNLNHVALYFDLSAQSYLAFVRVLDVVARTGSTLSLQPVSPALVAKLTSAPPAPKFTGNKANVLQSDIDRYAARWNLELRNDVGSTERALRVLHAAPDDSGRMRLTQGIFQALHSSFVDVGDVAVLKRMAAGILKEDEVEKAVQDDSVAEGLLERATEDFVNGLRGLSVPAFWVPDPSLKVEAKGVGFANGGKVFLGQDRLHFVESALRSNANLPAPVHMPRIARGPLSLPTTLTVWFDFSSPWTYLGFTQLPRIQAEAGTNLKIVMKPTLLGIVFKEIGTPIVPTAVASKARQEWQQVELKRWAEYWSTLPYAGGKAPNPVPFHWNDHFPLRTPLALRIVCAAIANNWSDAEVMKLCNVIFKACWADNVPIADKPPGSDPLVQYLTKAGYDGQKLASDAWGNSKAAGDLLRKNTADAVASGICGFPTFQIGDDLVWGQDRLDVAKDLLFGWDWRDGKAITRPKL
ncbi:thioredoxin-like protein [Hyaloraphidium curvatum]|nr:thioredoxin-like protein [Hyaloraphidium curvatum]